MGACAACFLLAGGVLGLSALHSGGHELAVLAARRVLVAAHGSLVPAQLAVLVAARVVVLGAQESSIALFIALDAQIAAEGLFRLGEAPPRLGLQHFTDGTQGAGREFLERNKKTFKEGYF